MISIGDYYVAPQHIAWIGPIREGDLKWNFWVCVVDSQMRFDYDTRDEAEKTRDVVIKAAR